MMKIVIAIILLGIQAATAIRDNTFLHRFEHIQAVSKCFGDGATQMWFEMVSSAVKECYGEPLRKTFIGQDDIMNDLASLMETDQSVARPETIFELDLMGTFPSLPFVRPTNSLDCQQKRISQLDVTLLQNMVMKTMAKVSNLTCVMQKVKLIDEEYNIQVDLINGFIIGAKLNPMLQDANIWHTKYCYDKAMGLPNHEVLLPIGVQRAIAFWNCDKDFRVWGCIKQDLLRHYMGVDLNKEDVLQSKQNKIKLSEKLTELLWIAEAKDDFEVY